MEKYVGNHTKKCFALVQWKLKEKKVGITWAKILHN